MPIYTYTGNIDPTENTSKLVLRAGALVVKKGQWADFTEEELSYLQQRFIMTLGSGSSLPAEIFFDIPLSLGQLDDVDITGVTNGQTLVWDGSTNNWIAFGSDISDAQAAITEMQGQITTFEGVIDDVQEGEAGRNASIIDFESRVTSIEEVNPVGSVVYAKRYLDNVIYANPAAAINAAMSTGTGTYGGRVILPEGIIDPAGEIIFPNKPIELEGAAENATFLRWLTDLGSGKWAIRRTDQLRQHVRKLTLYGPQDGVIDGAVPGMWGIQHLSRNYIEDVHVQGFRAGCTVAGDHGHILRSEFSANRDGIYFHGRSASGIATEGNHVLTDLDVAGNGRAGIALAPDCVVTGATWANIHFGMGPLAFLYEVDGSNNAATMLGIHLDACAFENFGNGLVYCMSNASAGAGIFDVTMTDCRGSQGFRAGFVSAALRNQRAHLDQIMSVNINARNTDVFGVGPGPVPQRLHYGGQYSLIQIDNAGIMAAGEVGSPLAGFRATENVVYAQHTYKDMARHKVINGFGFGVALTSGLLVTKTGYGAGSSGGYATWSAGRTVDGVVLQSGIAWYDTVLIGVEGEHLVANSDAVAVGDYLIPDPANPGKVKPAGAAPGAVCARATAAAAAGATVLAEFSPTSWRF